MKRKLSVLSNERGRRWKQYDAVYTQMDSNESRIRVFVLTLVRFFFVVRFITDEIDDLARDGVVSIPRQLLIIGT